MLKPIKWIIETNDDYRLITFADVLGIKVFANQFHNPLPKDNAVWIYGTNLGNGFSHRLQADECNSIEDCQSMAIGLFHQTWADMTIKINHLKTEQETKQ